MSVIIYKAVWRWNTLCLLSHFIKIIMMKNVDKNLAWIMFQRIIYIMDCIEYCIIFRNRYAAVFLRFLFNIFSYIIKSVFLIHSLYHFWCQSKVFTKPLTDAIVSISNLVVNKIRIPAFKAFIFLWIKQI